MLGDARGLMNGGSGYLGTAHPNVAMMTIETRSTSWLKRSVLCSGLLFLALAAIAQVPGTVDLGLFQAPGANTLEVRVRPNGTGYNGVVTALTFTIRWESASGALLGGLSQVIDGNNCPSQTLPIQPSPDGQVDAAGFRYLNFNGFGFVPLSGCSQQAGYSWPANAWTPVMRVPVLSGAGCAAFSIVNDTYTAANNQDYYLSLFGAESNGAIVTGPVYVDGSTVACADCAGVPGGESLPGTPCNDGNDCTLDDRYDTDCNCTGLPLVAGFTLPNEAIVAGVPAQFQSTSTSGAGLLWSFGDGNTSSEASPIHTWTLPGTYALSLQASNGGCTAIAEATIPVGVSTGIGATPGTGVAMAWVAEGQLWLRIGHGAGTSRQVDLYDMAGRCLARYRIGPGTLHQLPLPCSTGMLVVRVLAPHGSTVLRVMPN
jgi:hypothetical protein